MDSSSLSLARAALQSPFKRPRPDATAPDTRLTTTLTPDPHHLTAYERTCGFATGTGRERDVLPLTYPHVLAFPLAMRLMTARDFPLPLLGLVHTSIDITQHRPPHPTEEMRLDVRTTKLGPHRRGTEATVTTTARSAADELLWESTSTYLARHKTASSTAPAAKPRPRTERPEATHTTEWRLGPDLGRRYAAVSGDRNPIHLHPLTARLFGFPRAIAHGMWTAARCLAEHTATQPEPHAQPPTHTQTQTQTHAHVDFKAPVLLPATVTYTAHGPSRFELRGPDGTLHLTGEARTTT
ncbi:MaoC/PaaZ C-terminal domain-containing protein [Streptomyces sp. NPDC052114]|uniref:MaoC/PaaZ C-terminal domain-containing protein n=1 Tax=unclassified Streptomyces TaxID=2593676 RepID=UPI003437E1DA